MFSTVQNLLYKIFMSNYIHDERSLKLIFDIVTNTGKPLIDSFKRSYLVRYEVKVEAMLLKYLNYEVKRIEIELTI